MSEAWETTTEDVQTVLNAHNVTVDEEELDELHTCLDHDAIVNNLLDLCTVDAQTTSMLSDIEDDLMESGVIPKGDKKFNLTPEQEIAYEDDESEC